MLGQDFVVNASWQHRLVRAEVDLDHENIRIYGLRRRERSTRLSDRLLAIGRDCAARLNEPFRSADHGDLLYGEDGLPK